MTIGPTLPPIGGAALPVRAVMVCAAFFGLPDQDVSADGPAGGSPVGPLRSGEVIHGNKLGRELGIPTANIALPGETALPFGVYAVLVRARGRWWAGAASWGTRPHFDDGAPLLEVHLLDFRGDLYGQRLEVEFLRRLRPERTFRTLDAMMARIARDIADTRRLTAPHLARRTARRPMPPPERPSGEGRLALLLEGGVFA